METHIFRVIVRGRFADLSDDDRRRLKDEHDPMRLPRFTEAGDFTHDGRPDFFTYRIQLRQRAETVAEAAESAEDTARSAALADLAARGVGHRNLSLSVRAMADVWR